MVGVRENREKKFSFLEQKIADQSQRVWKERELPGEWSDTKQWRAIFRTNPKKSLNSNYFEKKEKTSTYKERE